jgi:hypothetical protein
MDRYEHFGRALHTLNKNEQALLTLDGKKFIIKLASEEDVIMHELNVHKKDLF